MTPFSNRTKLKNYIRYINYIFQYDSREGFVKTEIESAKVLIQFLKFQNKNKDEIIEILYNRYEIYKSRFGFVNSYIHLKTLVKREIRQKTISFSTFKYISELSTKYRLFVLYSLIEFAASDKIFSLKEDSFIDSIREKIKIPKSTLKSIIEIYSKNGLKEERIIIEEEARRKTAKKTTKTFLPYKAYKILGVSSSIPKRKLKKAYRTLAKKYHPDKFHGQDDVIIQEMEDKFQEITEAYEIIKRYKNYN